MTPYLRTMSTCAALGLAFGLPVAQAVPMATSASSTGCGVFTVDNRTNIGPITVAVRNSCAAAGVSAGGTYDVSSDVLPDFGRALPQVGSVNAAANALATGPGSGIPGSGSGGAEASGRVIFYFTVEQIDIPPSSLVPLVNFEAHGAGGFMGSGRIDGIVGASAVLDQAGTETQWGIGREIHDEPWNDQFVQSINLGVLPNELIQVNISAGCTASATALAANNSMAECNATVDASVRLGQEAFDAAYGNDSFRLSDYYQIIVSPNIPGAVEPIPEPGTFSLVALGGLCLIRVQSLGRFGRRKVFA